MKKKFIRLICLLIPLAFMCFCHMQNRPQSAVSEPPGQTSAAGLLTPDQIVPQATAPPALRLYASEACLMDASSGRVLYGKEASSPLPMASTTKIMTCLLALEKGDLNSEVIFSDRAASMPRVHLGASSGQSFRLKDLLYSLMLESHNDTAVAIAEHIGGSVEGFAAMMNEKAGSLGMVHTSFVTPNGLDADGHQSSPEDMCRLAAYACQNERFLRIVQTPSRTIRDKSGTHRYSLSNHDAFLTSYKGALGIKTGFTGKAGYCFVGAAIRDDRLLTSCVLASGWPPDKSRKWADTKALMDYGFEHYTWQLPPVRNLADVRVTVVDGKMDSVSLAAVSAAPVLISAYDTVEVTYRIPSVLTAPVKKDTEIGTVEVSVGGSLMGAYPVYPADNVQEKEFTDFLAEIIKLFTVF